MSEENAGAEGADATAAAIQAAVEKETQGLKAKNDELLGKLKKREAEMSDIRAEIDKIKGSAAAAEQAKAEADGDIDKLKAHYEAKLEEMAAERDASNARFNKSVVDAALSDAITGARVKPELADAAKALIRANSKIEVKEVDGEFVALADHISLSEHIAAWAGSDQGKHFVAADMNGGGGAQGARDGKAGAKTMKRSQFDAMSLADRSKAMAGGDVRVVDD